MSNNTNFQKWIIILMLVGTAFIGVAAIINAILEGANLPELPDIGELKEISLGYYWIAAGVIALLLFFVQNPLVKLLRNIVYLVGAGLFVWYFDPIVEWAAPYLATSSPAEYLGWGVDEIEARAFGITLILLGGTLFFFWFFLGEGNAISNRFFFGVIFTALALQIVPDQYKSFANQPNCTFKDRIGFEFGLHQVAPKTLGREGDADEWIDPLQNNDPRILNTRQGVDTILCPGDSSYVMVAPGTHLEIDFTTGFAQAKDNIRKVSLGETGGYHIGEFVQVEYIPSNNGDPVYRLYRVHVKDSMFGDTIGTGHDWIEVTVRTVPRRF